MIPFLIICAAVIVAIIIGYYAWLFWPTRFDINSRKGARLYTLFRITTRHDLHKALKTIQKDSYYRRLYSEIYVYKYLKSKDDHNLIQTIKWD